MIGGTIHDTIQSEFNITPLPESVWDLILVVGLAAVLYLGVALSTRAQLALALISFGAVLIFCLYVIIKLGGGNHIDTAFKPSSSPQGLRGVMFGVLYGVLLFTGFEAAANLGEETVHPKRDIPRAVLISVLAVTGFYIVSSYAQVAGYHFSLDALGKNSGAPLFGLAGPVSDGGFGSVAVRRLIELVVVFDMLAVMIGCATSATRGLFALARDRRLPTPMARISQRRGTPLVASAVVVAVHVVVIILTETWKGLLAQSGLPHYVAMFSWGSTFGGFALAVIYLLMAVGAMRGLRDHMRPWAVYLASLVGIAVTGAAIFGSFYHVTAPVIYAPYAALALLALGLAFAFVHRDDSDTPLGAADAPAPVTAVPAD
jgi:amino acid transporter